jgi:hypothetical protein
VNVGQKALMSGQTVWISAETSITTGRLSWNLSAMKPPAGTKTKPMTVPSPGRHRHSTRPLAAINCHSLHSLGIYEHTDRVVIAAIFCQNDRVAGATVPIVLQNASAV